MKSVAAWLITAVWVALYVRKLADPTFPVPAEVTPVMLLAAGWLFGRDVREKLRERVGKALEAEPSRAEGDEANGAEVSSAQPAED
jgi:hypothetical protein